jgi:galactose mutarotase-like enzyme
MQAQGQLITLRDSSGAKAVIAPELGGWLLRYTRHLPELGYVEGLHFAQEVVDRYPNQMYAGNPLLFPQVSFSHLPGKEHHYQWKGQTFALPQHGFARRSKWRVTGVNESRVMMELSDSQETRKAYPFSFGTEVTYELREGRLHYRQVVENRGDGVMPFSTGIHPYLPVPIMAKGERNDCFVELPGARRVVTNDEWRSWRTEPFATKKLPVGDDVSGTLFLTDLGTPEISLVDPSAAVKITLNFAQAPAHRYVALWSKSTSDPFYCIEPWTALPNSLNREKSELIELAPGAKFEAGMWFNVSRV